jgi:hypothetical protein
MWCYGRLGPASSMLGLLVTHLIAGVIMLAEKKGAK